MGIIPGPTEYGDDCALCFPTGKTPAFWKLFVTSIEHSPWYGDEWGTTPNGYIDLFQSENDPCTWHSKVATRPIATLRTFAGQTTLQVWTRRDVPAFLDHTDAQCVFSFTNEFVGQFPFGFQGGWAYATPVQALQDVVESITPMIDPDPRLECFITSPDEAVVRYAGKRDATNISIKFDL